MRGGRGAEPPDWPRSVAAGPGADAIGRGDGAGALAHDRVYGRGGKPLGPPPYHLE